MGSHENVNKGEKSYQLHILQMINIWDKIWEIGQHELQERGNNFVPLINGLSTNFKEQYLLKL